MAAISVTVIGVALIVTPMTSGGDEAATLARDTVFAANMITRNGIVGIALLVLSPETVAAVRAALRNRLQVSLNLALGSALAGIGLTIPAIAVASVWLTGPLVLGLGGTELVLLALTGAVGTLTMVSGRATVLQGSVHLMVLSAFLFLAVTP